ncbi:hypothetical protein AK830_g6481 [Neonectria ditissima]|uniref:Asteroid domain-containing protein n=1 Tax=Neonectria ditissima TaxID=78410 RepID=A0A0P7B0F2_9HYPO|nr:hypothetical protein AK830_g6481 [Neonectria ditissima]
MGIPHLISTLEPFAVHGLLDDKSVVIDGPAFAYHILYICNINGVVLPSYQLLGDTAVAWLDELTRRRVSVSAIFFDGYLPLGKRPVRMGRVAKSFHQLKTAHSADPSGRSRSYLSSPTDRYGEPALFSSKPPPGRPFLPPSFHVPAIIEALRLSPRYQSSVRLVPGEADAFCAQHLLESGGTVLTSDSDLLAHDLGRGSVMFFRHIQLDGDSRLACAAFSPRHICERLGLPSDQSHRLAYERKLDPHLSLPQILQQCSKPVADTAGYHKFCQEYLHQEIAPLPVPSSGATIQIHSLDPRISELVLQAGSLCDREDMQEAKIFLPILIEDPTRGSAWEQSTSIRQLAYTILRWIIPGQAPPVQEYRRVNNTVQKGRQVSLLAKAAASEFGKAIVDLMTRIRKETEHNAELSWLILSLSLDIRHCYEEDKQSHALQTIQKTPQVLKSSKVTWGIIHFVAQLQAAYYSLRILRQVLSLVPSRETIPELHKLLVPLPPLAEFPNIDRTIEFLSNTNKLQSIKLLEKFVPFPKGNTHQSKRAAPRKRKASGESLPKAKPSASVRAPITRNPFDVLSQDG